VSDLSLKFNCAKSFSIAFGQTYDTHISDMKLGNNMIGWSTSIKYLGLSLLSGRSVTVDDSLIRRKFYASCNAILSNSVGQCELTRLFLLEIYCLPILTYCTMAINMSQKCVHSFNVCWNMMYRRLFNFNKWESVSLFIAGMGRLNFTYLYQWLQYKMLKKFMLHSAFVVKNLLQCYLIEPHFIETCRRYDISFLCLNVVKSALWSSVCLLVS